MQIFKVFAEGLFFDSGSIFQRPGSRKACRKEAEMEAEATLEAPSGKCKKHGRGCVFNTLGHIGETPGGDFFLSGSPDPFWKDPGEHFGRILQIFVTFRYLFRIHFEAKHAMCIGTEFS